MDNEKSLVEATCESILDTTKTIDNEESNRFKLVESKVNITIAFNGVLLAVYLAYLNNYELLVNDV